MRQSLVAFIASVIALLSATAQAEKRVALVIGNAAYRNAAELKNPRNDAADVAAALKGLGFKVIEGRDLDKAGMDRIVRDFSEALVGADVGLFFYAGHGLQVAGSNYLVPIDAKLTSSAGLDFEMIRLDLVQRQMERETKTNVLFLDACRDNPLARNLARAMGTRSTDVGRGLANAESGVGTLISFATQPGNVALDGEGRNSPFTAALIKHIATPGRDLNEILIAVRNDVRQVTAGRQVPWENSALTGLFYFRDGAPTVAAPAPSGPAGDEIAWSFVKDTKDAEQLRRFIEQFPASARRSEAAARLFALEQAKVAVVAPPVAPAAPPDTRPTPVVGVFGANPLSAARERALKPKDSFKECDTCPEMVVVPVGSFTMGSPESEKERLSWEGPQHRVTFARQFAVGKFAVTFEQWDACVADGGCNGHKPKDEGWGRGRRPVINVSWNDAKAYVAWLSKKTGKTYRLLSEAEREYVTRAGTTTAFWWGSSISPSQANYNGNYTYGSSKGEWRQKTVPVDSFQPNPWGLHQVHGDVYEWLEDCFNNSYRGAPADGSPWRAGDCQFRAMRGGSWFEQPKGLRSAGRSLSIASSGGTVTGFRVARTLDQVAAVAPPVAPTAPPAAAPQPAVGVSAARAAAPLSLAEERALKPKDGFKECDTCPAMVVVPAGSFTMGSPPSEKDRSSMEDPQHGVTFAKPFAVGRLEVTVDQFASFVKESSYDAGSECYGFDRARNVLGTMSGRTFRNPGFSQTGSHPAACLSWHDAKAYVAWLSEKTGKTYRLLTEAEWEYAGRAGTRTRFYFGDNEKVLCSHGNGIDQSAKSILGDSILWRMLSPEVSCDDGYAYTAPAGSFAANAFGLHDMQGNVWEWVEDCWNGSYSSAPTDGSAWTSGDCNLRMVRGGSWISGPAGFRAAHRFPFELVRRDTSGGFRVARTLTQ